MTHYDATAKQKIGLLAPLDAPECTPLSAFIGLKDGKSQRESGLHSLSRSCVVQITFTRNNALEGVSILLNSRRHFNRSTFLGGVTAAAAASQVTTARAAPEPRTFRALVLSGGTAYGAYEAGVLQGIDGAQSLPFDMVCGTSIGALNGCMYAMGQVEALVDLWKNISVYGVLELIPQVATALDSQAGLITRAYDAVSAFISMYSGTQSHIARTDPIRRVLRHFLLDGPNAVRSFRIPMYWAVTDIERGCGDYYTVHPEVGPFASLFNAFKTAASARGIGLQTVAPNNPEAFIESLRASTAIPGLFEPGRANGRYYTDGGVVNNTPVNLAKLAGTAAGAASIEVNVVLLGKDLPQVRERDTLSAASILLRAFNIMRQRLVDDAVRAAATEALLDNERKHAGNALALARPSVKLKYIAPSKDLVGESVNFSDKKSIETNIALGLSDFNTIGWRAYEIPSDLCKTSSA